MSRATALKVRTHAIVRLWAADRLCGRLSGLPGFPWAAEIRERARKALAPRLG